ncbi:MAG: ABC transporter ATP-binding protein [Candidatus Staskawiczbacteria bacterium]|nr:ABC transporter ATP-binding protein [Candidatus Staskawiczbacteria bacterium]
MDDLAIKVDGLWKSYKFGVHSAPRTLRSLAGNLFSSKNKPSPLEMDGENKRDDFWALSDISFEIKKGEVVGLIGANGAGKSTLLKILSRVIRPTRGQVKIWGRVGSLLEIGTGFHPELSGHENIYLNGAIIGMTRLEVKKRYEEIVEFAGNEKKFLHMPVKYYSSGMFMRLAFSIAINLNPDILFLDEVFAVGDAAFQKKSYERLNEMIKSGRTVVIVSHSASSIKSMCSRAIFLEGGNLIADGRIAEVYRVYNEHIIDQINKNAIGLTSQNYENKTQHSDESIDPDTLQGSDPVSITSKKVLMRDVRVMQDGVVKKTVDIDRDILVELEYEVFETSKINVSIQLLDSRGNPFLATPNYISACVDSGEVRSQPLKPGIYRSECRILPNFLNDRLYSVNAVLIVDNEFYSQTFSCSEFSVFDTGVMRTEFAGEWDDVPIRPIMEWSTFVKT